MVNAPVLAHYDDEEDLVLQTKVSGEGLVAVPSQISEDGRCNVIAFASRSLLKAEKNYSVSDQEILLVVWAVEKFDTTYIGGPKTFKVITDHNAPCGLFRMKMLQAVYHDG